MAKSFEVSLKSKLNIFAEKFSINVKSIGEDDWFEMFSNYIVISNLLNENLDDPNSISTGKAKGIDGIGIIVNNRVIKEESDLEKIGEKEKIVVRLCFIQSTICSSFNLKKFQSFTDEVVNFLKENNTIEPFSDIINNLFNEENRFVDQMTETPIVDLYFCSGKTYHQLSNEDIELEKNKIRSRTDFKFQFDLENIFLLQKEELKSYYENIDKFLEFLIEFNPHIRLTEKENIPISFVSVMKFSELKKIIVTEEGNGFLREKLFVENVRSKIENSPVNDDILSSLKDEKKRPYFLYLNNGLTILCEEVRSHPSIPNNFYIKYPRIINGCQTSHILFDYFKTNPKEADQVELIAKIISTTNPNLKKDIIYATNNQNAIDKDLETLNDFHSKLEEHFIGRDGFGIYFERLRGQYSEITPPYKVLTKELIAKSYISIFLQVPHLMKSNAPSKIEKFRSEEKIFTKCDNEELDKYYYSGFLYYLLHNMLANKVIQLKSKTMDMHLLLACNLNLEKIRIVSIADKMEYLKNIENVKHLFIKVNEILEGKKYLFDRRGFYSRPKTKKLIKEFQ